MDDPPSMVIKYNHGIKHPKRRGRDDEHVDRDDDCHMVSLSAAKQRHSHAKNAEKSPPGEINREPQVTWRAKVSGAWGAIRNKTLDSVKLT
jgi:hypothetical protein